MSVYIYVCMYLIIYIYIKKLVQQLFECNPLSGLQAATYYWLRICFCYAKVVPGFILIVGIQSLNLSFMHTPTFGFLWKQFSGKTIPRNSITFHVNQSKAPLGFFFVLNYLSLIYTNINCAQKFSCLKGKT